MFILFYGLTVKDLEGPCSSLNALHTGLLQLSAKCDVQEPFYSKYLWIPLCKCVGFCMEKIPRSDEGNVGYGCRHAVSSIKAAVLIVYQSAGMLVFGSTQLSTKAGCTAGAA